jgi:transposase-like protein
MRNVLNVLPKGRQEMAASIIPTIFARPDAEHIDAQFVAELVRMIERVHPKTTQMLEDARNDILAFRAFPTRHWRQIWSTNPPSKRSSGKLLH